MNEQGDVLSPWVMSSQPLQQDEGLPAEREVVLVWLTSRALPFCGYIRYNSDGPYWVVYHGNTEIGSDVVAWRRYGGPQGPTQAACDFMAHTRT